MKDGLILVILVSLMSVLNLNEAANMLLKCSSTADRVEGKYFCLPIDKLTTKTCSQCAAGVKYFCSTPTMSTSQWKKGVNVVEDCKKVKPTIPKYTAIATFSKNSYNGHAAVFLKCGPNRSIIVADQWDGKLWGKRTINYKPGQYVSNDSGSFYAVQY